MPAVAGKPQSKRRIKPYAQRDLNSMCGIYAIINAFCTIGREITGKSAPPPFQHLVHC